MKPTHFKITLLKPLVSGIEYSNTGEFRLWKIKEIMKHGSYVIECGTNRSILQKEEIEKGERHSEPNFSLPLGLHIKIEKFYKPHWYSKGSIINY